VKTTVCKMTIQQDSIPTLSKPRNKVVAVEDIQLEILALLKKYSARKCKLNYSFAIKNTKLTLDVDVLLGEENHYTVAGGRGARRRRTKRRRESGHVYQRNTPTTEAETPRNELPNARSRPGPTLTEKPVPASQPKKQCDRCPLVCVCVPESMPQSMPKSVPLPSSRSERPASTTPEVPFRKVAKLLDDKNKKRDLNDQPWFYDSISRQQVSDLLLEKGEIGDFVIRESSNNGHFVLSWRGDKMQVNHELIIVHDGKYIIEHHDWEKFDSLEALVKFYVENGYIIRPLRDKLMHKKDAETRGKRSLAKRIFCFYCFQYHGQVHFCHRTQQWRNVDTSLLMEMVGDTRKSVERPPGYVVDNMVDFTFYKSRWAMFTDMRDKAANLPKRQLFVNRKCCKEDQFCKECLARSFWDLMRKDQTS